MPSTEKITETVLSSGDVIRHTNERYYLWPGKNMGKGYVKRIQSFLWELKFEIEDYYKRFGRDVSYEDLYYVASQIEDSKTGEYPNPVVQSFIDKILPQVESLLCGREGESRRRWTLNELASEATHCIHDVTQCLLHRDPSGMEHLSVLNDACLDNELSAIDIFTLNHDTVLESFFSNKQIAFADGFGKVENQVRYWKPHLYENKAHKMRIFKLHGSVNWFRFRPEGGDWYDELIGIPLKGDPDDTRSPQGKKQSAPDNRPMMLIGTTNKILQYVKPIYADLLSRFYSSLQNSGHLVICGYGFGDREINTQMSYWVFSSPDLRITIVDIEPEKLRRRMPASMFGKWDKWIKERKLATIRKRIEETSWADIKERIL
ncbi:MAG: hypothetical protein E3J56_14110 [Candidatus Aminicenantes bacterium]|nr:MAG: hypothetical protein E3J56_14110 [Candidatus Aminicenantes bacterium]